MAVYVDDTRVPYGGMTMCHMHADTDEELHAMAGRIGVARRWRHGDHYDICLAKRALAVQGGAIEITKREAVKVRRRVRGARRNESPKVRP
ncbi:MAG: DUF4031 domain-containing protein [Methylocystis sp.]|uniref:DUF4031 domain-containing protein n=1 Tax=Methylocystis sp. TaxID=1911079 RepID=UPI003DA3DE9F